MMYADAKAINKPKALERNAKTHPQSVGRTGFNVC
jgi:hypothetical protein